MESVNCSPFSLENLAPLHQSSTSIKFLFMNLHNHVRKNSDLTRTPVNVKISLEYIDVYIPENSEKLRGSKS